MTSSHLGKLSIGVVMPLGHQQGGAETLLAHWLRNGSERYRLHCAFLQPGPLPDLAIALGYPTVVFHATRLSDARNYLAIIRKLHHWIQSERLAAVFSWMAKAQLYVAPASLGTSVHTFWYQHGMPRPTRINRFMAYVPANRIFCCSRASKEAQDLLAPQRDAAVCHPGVSFPDGMPLTQAQARESLRLPLDRPTVGMVARLERWKGVHVFIEAARRTALARPETHFFIVGGPHPRDLAYAEELRDQADRSGLGDRLRFLGQVPPDDVRLWQAAADLIVHPVTGEEPFGMAVVEAMGLGRPVVASDTAGPSEIIDHGVNGFLVPPGDTDALTETIIHSLAEPEQLHLIGKAAFVRGRNFSIPSFAARLDELISETLQT